jgi:DNA-binding CsgD family transcriptional regulator
MRVYILSENRYFAEGMLRLMTHASFTAHILPYEDKIDEALFHHGLPGVVFVDASRVNDCLASIMGVDSHCLQRIFCLSEHYSDDYLSRNNFVSMVSRHTSVEKIVSSLTQLPKIPRKIVSNNDSGLSSHELSILHYHMKGNSKKEISDKLNLSIKTISAYRARALLKLGVDRISLKSIPYVKAYISRAAN